ncbi:MAG: hypothetical protein H7644_09665 [Candidatus Heimdallarchaeota archaeon]|nr:hypothetical protein [Candidatus Heimdallarchaeota archaeon]MCK5144021.1 hypothetical protein [Candidatus Heimdallarchaeota archaeon]
MSEVKTNISLRFSFVFSFLLIRAIVVEHDFMMLNFTSDRLMVFDGIPGEKGSSKRIGTLQNGMNSFLRKMDITFRQNPRTLRPRVNKKDSQLDKKQKSEGNYFLAA